MARLRARMRFQGVPRIAFNVTLISRPSQPQDERYRTASRSHGRRDWTVMLVWPACRPSLAPFPGPYSAHGQIPRLEDTQGPRAPDACQGGTRAARADRARAGKAAQSRDREGDRGRRIADGAATTCGQLMGSPGGFLCRAHGAEVDARDGAGLSVLVAATRTGLSAPLPLAGRGRGWGSRE